MLVVAVLSPVLGAIADYAGIKKKMMAGFLVLGVPATAALFLVGPRRLEAGRSRSSSSATSASTASFVFYESLLPHIARADEIDRVSTAGYALGYLGPAGCC